MKLKHDLGIVAVAAAILCSCQKGESIVKVESDPSEGKDDTEVVIPPGKLAVSATEDFSEVKKTKAYNDRWSCNWGRGSASGYGYYDEKETASMTVTPASGWSCYDWNRDGSPRGGGGNFLQPVGKNYVILPFFQKTVTVTYNGNGGTPSVGSKAYTFTYIGDVAQGSVSYSPETATLSGSDFDGWFTAASGGTSVTAITESLAAGTTLYAQWKKGFTISGSGTNCKVNANGKALPQSFKSGTSISLTATPTSGYRFHHFAINGTEDTSNPATFTISSNTLANGYAYPVNTITVKSDGNKLWLTAGRSPNDDIVVYTNVTLQRIGQGSVVSNKGFTLTINAGQTTGSSVQVISSPQSGDNLFINSAGLRSGDEFLIDMYYDLGTYTSPVTYGF